CLRPTLRGSYLGASGCARVYPEGGTGPSGALRRQAVGDRPGTVGNPRGAADAVRVTWGLWRRRAVTGPMGRRPVTGPARPRRGPFHRELVPYPTATSGAGPRRR